MAAVDDNCELPDITKFSYLLSLLKSEARMAVQGLSLTAANYRTACEILGKRYGRPERIIFSHLQELLTLSVPRKPSVTDLWRMYDDLQAHVRSLDALGISGEQYGVALTPLILSRLTPELRLEWARDSEQHESDLLFLLNFLRAFSGEGATAHDSRAFSREGATTDEGPSTCSPVATASALHASIETGRTTCELCGRQGHALERCFKLIRAPVGERQNTVKRVGACFRCLTTAKGHVYRNCDAKCTKCQGKHHALLCGPKRNSVPYCDNVTSTSNSSMRPNAVIPLSSPCVSHVSGNVSNVNSVSGTTTHVFLQTARGSVHGKCGVADAIILFDTGSDKTYISRDLVDRIGPEWVGSQNLAYAVFGGNHISNAEQRNVYSVSLQGSRGDAVSLVATEIPMICAPMFRPAVPDSVLGSFGKDIEFVDVPMGQKIKVDILVGLDSYWKLMTPEIVVMSDGLVAQRSVFGWILSGPSPAPTIATSQLSISHQLFCSNISEDDLTNFWNL